MGLEKVARFIQLRIRVNHYRSAIVCGVKDVEMTVAVCFEQHAYAIAFVKVMIRINSHAPYIFLIRILRSAKRNKRRRGAEQDYQTQPYSFRSHTSNPPVTQRWPQATIYLC